MESYDEAEFTKHGDKEDKNDTFMKHKEHKNQYIEDQMATKFEKMKYMMDCGFNLLVYGVGSRYQVLNLFFQSHLSKQAILQCNGYVNTCNIKNLLAYVQKYINDYIYKG